MCCSNDKYIEYIYSKNDADQKTIPDTNNSNSNSNNDNSPFNTFNRNQIIKVLDDIVKKNNIGKGNIYFFDCEKHIINEVKAKDFTNSFIVEDDNNILFLLHILKSMNEKTPIILENPEKHIPLLTSITDTGINIDETLPNINPEVNKLMNEGSYELTMEIYKIYCETNFLDDDNNGNNIQNKIIELSLSNIYNIPINYIKYTTHSAHVANFIIEDEIEDEIEEVSIKGSIEGSIEGEVAKENNILKSLEPKHAGLINDCNKCWLNAGIQLIGYIDDLAKQLTNLKIKDLDSEPDKTIKTGIKNLFTDLISGNNGKAINYGVNFTDVSDIKYGNLYEYFYKELGVGKKKSGSFEDSAEALAALFNYFSEFPSEVIKDNTGKIILQNERTGLTLDYNSYMYNLEITTNCLYKTPTKNPNIQLEPYFIYTLEVPKDEGQNLNEYFKTKLNTSEISTAGNERDGCKINDDDTTIIKGPSTKTIKILPNKYFIIQLKLFDRKLGEQTEKLKTNLIISKEIDIDEKKYKLSGFILHIGEKVDGVHYVFYKMLADGSGYLYDDKMIINITIENMNVILSKNEKNNTPYILLYEKDEGSIIKPPIPPATPNTEPAPEPAPEPEPAPAAKPLTQTIEHIWYKDWTDHGVPENIEKFRSFCEKLKDDIIKNKGTTLIHCSAGVGRTGTLYTVLKLMFNDNILEFKNNKKLYMPKDIIDIINKARTKRVSLVQTSEQLGFIFNVFNIKQTPDEIKLLHTKLENYNVENDTDQKAAKAQSCPNLNRYSNILPFDDFSVELTPNTNLNITGNNGSDCSDYVNASKLDGFTYDTDNLDVIAAECPKNDVSIIQFKRMLKQKDVKRIIMLTGLIEDGRIKCNDYTDSLGSTDTPLLSNKKNDIWKTALELTGKEPNFRLIQKLGSIQELYLKPQTTGGGSVKKNIKNSKKNININNNINSLRTKKTNFINFSKKTY